MSAAGSKGYSEHFDWARTELKGLERRKQDTIRELARRLEQDGMPTELIAPEIAKQLEGYASSRYIRDCLEKKFKQNTKVRCKQQPEVCGTTSAKSQSVALLETYGEGNEPMTDNREVSNDLFEGRSMDSPPDVEQPVHQDTCRSCKEKDAAIAQLRSELHQPFEGTIPKDMADELLFQLEKSAEVCYVSFDRGGRLTEAESDLSHRAQYSEVDRK